MAQDTSTTLDAPGAPAAPADPATTRHMIRVRDGGEFACYGDQRVLVAMEQSFSRPIPVGCRRGGCGVCRVRVLDGAYSTAPMSATHVSPEEQTQGYALSCCIYPESDLLVELAPKAKAEARTTTTADHQDQEKTP